MIIVVGTGVLATSLLSSLAGGATNVLTGPGADGGAITVSLLLNIGLFWLGFRLATAREVTARGLFLGAMLAGVVWQILPPLRRYLVAHTPGPSSSQYSVFG